MRCYALNRKLKQCKNNCKFFFCRKHSAKYWGIIASLGVLAGLYQDLINPIFNLFPSTPNERKVDSESDKIALLKPIFAPADSTSFNVLIIRFEDYINADNTYCIGRSIQENIGIVNANENLAIPLKAIYADSIPPPKSQFEAQTIQKKHNADLIIYGLAKNMDNNCGETEVCFRYNISHTVVSNIAPLIDLKRSKHDAQYVLTSPSAIEKGQLKVDALSVRIWLIGLADLKSNNNDNAFLDFVSIKMDTATLSKNDIARKIRMLGLTYLKTNQFKRAIKAFDKSTELNPKDTISYNKRGVANKHIKNYREAILDYNKALKIDSTYASAYSNRGNAHRYLEEYDKAMADYTKAIELNPTKGDFYINRGILYSHLEKFDKAEEDYNKAIKINPKDTTAFNNRGVNFKEQGRYEQAIADYKMALSLDSTYIPTYNNYGIILKDQKKFIGAIEKYNHAINLSRGKHTFSYFNRAKAYLLTKNIAWLL